MRSILTLLLLGGCAPTLVQTASTVGKNQFEVGVEPGVARVAFAPDTDEEESNEVTVTRGYTAPVLNLAFRYGISDRVDLGARFGFVGYTLQARFALLPQEPGRFRLSVAPEMSILSASLGGTGGVLGRFNLGVLGGIPVGEHELVLGALGMTTFAGGTANGGGAGGFIGLFGGSVGFAAQVDDNVRLLPEIGYRPVLAAGASVTGAGNGLETLYVPAWSFTLGILITPGD